MKAAQITKYGGTDAITLASNIPTPTVSEGKVLIEVHAAGVNPFDWKLREGYMQQMIPLQFPSILGGDLAGVIKEIGPGVTGLTPGDKIYGQAMTLTGGSGAFAEYAVAPTKTLALAPNNID